MNELTVIIKLTYGCNLNCAYCYEGDKPINQYMGWETVKNTIIKSIDFIDYTTPVNFIWHGGEPLLMGLEFYGEVLKLQKEYSKGKTVHNSLQTNGTLTDKETLIFLDNNNINVGISLDGPAIIHDQQRYFKNDSGSFEDVFNSLMICRSIRKGKSNVGALAVFTNNTFSHLPEFYEFFRDNRINVKINPLIMSGRALINKNASDKLFVTPEQYGMALIYLFDRWISEKELIFTIEPFYQIIYSILNKKSMLCTFQNDCFERYISILPSGDIVPCGRWESEQYLYGNINQNSINSAFDSMAFHEFKDKRRMVKIKCGNCRYFEICNGGCPFSGYMQYGEISDKDYYCLSYKMLFKHIEKALSNNNSYKEI